MNAELLKKQVQTQLEILRAVADAIKELGSVPSGVLYAHLMSYMSLSQYERFISLLIDAKVISKSGNVLTWIG